MKALDDLIASIPTSITADVTTGHVAHSMTYKAIFELLAAGAGAAGGGAWVNISEFGGTPGSDCSDAFEDAIEAAQERNIQRVTVPPDPDNLGFIITRQIHWPEGVDFVGLSTVAPTAAVPSPPWTTSSAAR